MSARRAGSAGVRSDGSLACSECPARVLMKATGRPRKTCGEACSQRRQRRLQAELVYEQQAEAKAWWLGLSPEQRSAAMAYVARDQPPKNWRGGLQLWAYFCRPAFSCAGRVESGVY